MKLKTSPDLNPVKKCELCLIVRAVPGNTNIIELRNCAKKNDQNIQPKSFLPKPSGQFNQILGVLCAVYVVCPCIDH